MIARYPLTWPLAQTRTPSHKRRAADFRVDFVRSRDEMLHSLELLGARTVVVSSNVPLRQDGLPLAGTAEPTDPGVAVYFDRHIRDALGRVAQTRPFVIACDSYSRVRWNLRAIGATVDALRSIQRHGASSMLEQAFTGFAALPPPRADRPWHEVLGVPPSATTEQVRDAYRDLARAHHPDAGGDHELMSQINRAFETAKREGRA